MKFNAEGKKLLKKLEGFKAIPYKDSAGIFTVGWGHTGKDVIPNRLYTLEECEILFNRDVRISSNGIKKTIKCDLNDNQFSALVSFCYNIGISNFINSSLLRRLNNNEEPNIVARNEFPKWKFVTKLGKKIELDGLIKRRMSELELFTRPIE